MGHVHKDLIIFSSETKNKKNKISALIAGIMDEEL